MPADLGLLYVWSNTPEFMLYVVKDGKAIFADKVGTATDPTPVFSAEMTTIVSTNTNGRRVPKKRRLLSARCAAKPNKSVRPTIKEHFNTFQRGSTATSGLQEKAHKSGNDHVSFTKTHRTKSASH